jgi:hypothetical protein
MFSVLATAAVAGWAVSYAPGQLASVAALAGVGGVITFAVALTDPSRNRRNRTIATGVLLAATAVVVSAMGGTASARAGMLTVSGAILFCAAEVGDRASAQPRNAAHRSGVDRWSRSWVLGVAAGSAGVSYGVTSARGLLAGVGPAALVAGVVSVVLVAFLVLLVLRTQPRTGP